VTQLVAVALVVGRFVRAIATRWCYDPVRTSTETTFDIFSPFFFYFLRVGKKISKY